MPTNMMYADSMFPRLRENEDPAESIRRTNNYLYMLLEQLRYSFHNLELANFNAAALDRWEGIITDPIYVSLKGLDSKTAELTITAEKIAARLTDEVKGLESRITQTAGEIRTEVKNTKEGLESSISQTAGQIRSEVKNIKEGLESSISQTAGQIRSEVKSTKDGLESSITQTAGEIRTELSNTKTGLETTISTTASGLSASISSVDGRVTTLNAAVSGISTKVSDAENNISTLNQTANKINWLVKSGTSVSDFQMTDRAISLMAGSIDLSGYVTFTSLTEAGKSTINGANITTGTLSADKITSGTLDASKVTVSNLSASKIISGTLDASKVTVKNLNADNITSGIISANRLDLSDYVTVGDLKDEDSGTIIHGGLLKTGTVTASRLEGELIYLYDEDGYVSGLFKLAGADSYSGQKMDIQSGAVAILALYGSAYIGGSEGAFLDIDDFVSVGGDLAPSRSNENSCGTSSRKWTDIYAANDTIQTSDREQKKDIRYGLTEYDRFFDALAPCTFRFIDGHERIHMGMIAQDIEEQMAAHGIDSMELAAFIKSPSEDGSGYDYGLRYGEFISLLIDQVQKLKKRVRKLEEAPEPLSRGDNTRADTGKPSQV